MFQIDERLNPTVADMQMTVPNEIRPGYIYVGSTQYYCCLALASTAIVEHQPMIGEK
jgi:hypothetical protein